MNLLPRRVSFWAFLLLVVGALLTMIWQSHRELPLIREPDVDSLIRHYLSSTTGVERSKARTDILALGPPALVRLQSIALESSRPAAERCFAIEMLTAKPQATFALLSLIDDPETSVRFTARRVVRACMADLPIPRDPHSDTEAAVLRAWRDANAPKGHGALTFHDTPLPVNSRPDTSKSPTEIFIAWSRDGSFHTRSPYLVDLRAHGDLAVSELISLSRSDSPYVRTSATIVLGMLRNERGTRYLQAQLARAESAADSALLKTAISLSIDARTAAAP